MYLSDIYTVAAPLAGLPAVSIPIGKDSNGLPIGMQITGTAFAEARILSIAHWLEKQPSWDGWRPFEGHASSGSSSQCGMYLAF